MIRKPTASGEYIKKGTLISVIFLSLVVGFLRGMVFSAYKSGPRRPVQREVP